MRLEKNLFLSFCKRSWLKFLYILGFRPVLYKSIDTLVMNKWWKIHKTGDLSLLIEGSYHVNKELVDNCIETWHAIKDEHAKVFGMPQQYKDYLNKVWEVTTAKLQFALSQDSWDGFQLKLLELELEGMEGGKDDNEHKIKAVIETSKGYRLDGDIVTVKEYFTDIKLLEEKAHGGGN